MSATGERMSATLSPGLPERARLPWRRSVDSAALRRLERQWTAWSIAHVAPFVIGAGLLVWFKPVLGVISAILLVHAWALPELYANRGAVVVRTRTSTNASSEARSLLLLGDLVADSQRRLHEATGLITETGRLGTWVIGEAGALLLRPGGRRVDCFCVRATGRDLPHGDRIAHLLLALRCDEADFVTVANLAFSGARWRVRRRMPAHQRPALDAALASEAHSPDRPTA